MNKELLNLKAGIVGDYYQNLATAEDKSNFVNCLRNFKDICQKGHHISGESKLTLCDGLVLEYRSKHGILILKEE